MKVADLNRLAVLTEATRSAKKSAPRQRSDDVCDVKLSSLATWLADLRNEASTAPGVRSAEVARAEADIANGTLDQDLDAAVDALLLEL